MLAFLSSHVDSCVFTAAAFAASGLSTAALHPLDTVKTRLQAGDVGSNPLLGDPSRSVVRGLYRGVSMNVLKEAPDAAVFLTVSESLSHNLPLQSSFFASHITLTLLLSGAIGDAAGSILRLPAEVLCKRQQTSTSSVGWMEHLADTSPESWMTAWSAVLYRDVPNGALQIATFHTCRQWFGQTGEAVFSVAPDSLSDCIAGLLAGACAAALTTPLDVLVTRTATADHSEGCAEEEECMLEEDERRAQTPLDIAARPLRIGMRLVREEGLGSLTRGLGCRTLPPSTTLQRSAASSGCTNSFASHSRQGSRGTQRARC